MAFSLNSQEEVRRFTHIKNGKTVKIFVSEIDSITFSKFSNNPAGVLINGIVWASCNVNTPGTFVAHPEDAGMFYQWNRRVGWSSTDPLVNHEGGTTWDNSTPTGNTWEKANDPCPTGWRVPTLYEQLSLVYTDNFWGELNGVPGRFFGSGEQRVFLPAAGYRYGEEGWFSGAGNSGSFWNSTSDGNDYAHYLYFSDYTSTSIYYRSYGRSVRCVSE